MAIKEQVGILIAGLAILIASYMCIAACIPQPSNPSVLIVQ